MIAALIIYKFFSMKKQILNLGKALNKAEQKQIIGGVAGPCSTEVVGNTGKRCLVDSDCLQGYMPVCFNGCCNTAV
jgi:hypothetical protein